MSWPTDGPDRAVRAMKRVILAVLLAPLASPLIMVIQPGDLDVRVL